jgi:hypothetical protein
MDGDGKWTHGQALDILVKQMQEEKQKASLLDSLNDRQKAALDFLKNEWVGEEK